MRKSASIIIGIIICILVMGVSYTWAMALMDSVYAYRSPLKNSPPQPGDALGSPNTRSVVVVLIDALRYDTSLNENVMPYLNELRSQGASALMHSRPPSYSQAGYTVLLTGAWPDISDGPVITLDYADIPTFTQDDIFSAAHRAGLLTAISAYNWFDKLVPQDAVSESYYTPGEDQVADRQVTDAALPWLQQGKYQLVLIHLDQVDYAGHHEGGPIDPRWNAAATRADDLLKEIASAMNLNQDTLIVVSDHGQIDRGGHGGQDAVVLKEPFILAGYGVIPGKYNDIQMVDVAPTIATLLGTNIPATNEGHALFEMFDFSTAQVEKIKTALSMQQSQLAQDYQAAIGQPVIVSQSDDIVSATQAGMNAARENRLNNERIPRGVVGIVILILAIVLTAWYERPHFSWILGGLLTYLVVFNVKYLILDHKTFSLSSAVDATNLIVSTAMTTTIAWAVGWFFVLLGTRLYQYRPRKSAEISLRFVLFTLTILAIPILFNFVINGVTVTWTLPNFQLSFLGLIFLIQTLIVAAIGLVLTGISAIIGLFGHETR